MARSGWLDMPFCRSHNAILNMLGANEAKVVHTWLRALGNDMLPSSAGRQ